MSSQNLFFVHFVSAGAVLCALSVAPSAFGVESERRAWSWEAALTVEGFAVVDGGVERRGGVLTNVDLTAELDTGALGWWAGGTAFVYLLGNADGGTVPTAVVGDLQATSNIEAPETAKVFEAWYEHRWAEGRWRCLAGLHDLNRELYALETAGLFRNSSFGIGPDVSQAGISIFPTAALGLVGSVDGASRRSGGGAPYLRAAVYDGVPGDPEDPRGTQVILRGEDGRFWAAEAGWQREEAKIGVGGWHHTATFEDPAGIERDSNGGLYAIAEAPLAASASGGRLAGFAQLGAARSDRNAIETYVGAGLVWTAPHPARPNDALGLAIAHARLSDAARAGAQGVAPAAETAIELSYATEIRPWLILQPDLQYIHHPAAVSGTDDAVQVGLTVSWSR